MGMGEKDTMLEMRAWISTYLLVGIEFLTTRYFTLLSLLRLLIMNLGQSAEIYLDEPLRNGSEHEQDDRLGSIVIDHGEHSKNFWFLFVVCNTVAYSAPRSARRRLLNRKLDRCARAMLPHA